MNDEQQPLTADPQVVLDWLTHLYGGCPGFISLCSDKDGWAGRRFATDETGVEAAVQYASELDRRRAKGVYAQSTTLREKPGEGRGGEDLAYGLTHLWADGDFGTVGHKPGLDDLPAPPDADAVAKVVAESGLPAPSGWAHTGGGYNPIWQLAENYLIHNEDDRARVKEVTTGVQAILAAEAYRHGWSWDIEVGNLDRLMKVPGTVNRKEGLERPATIGPGTGEVFELADLAGLVAELAPAARKLLEQAASEKQERKAVRLGRKVPPPRAPRQPRTHSGDGPLDVVADMLGFRDILPSAGFTYEGIHSDGREKWLRAAAGGDRPSSAYSLLCNDHVAINWSERSDLPVGALAAGQKLTIGTLYAHLNYGGDTSEAARDIMRAAAGRATQGAAGRLPITVLTEVKRRCQKDSEAQADGAPSTFNDYLAQRGPTDAGLNAVHHRGAEEEREEYDRTPQIVFRKASSFELKKTEWLWDTTKPDATPHTEGRIPKAMLSVAAGLPGTGKSQFAIYIAAKITRGTLPGCFYEQPKNVIYAATEDDWERTLAPRLVAAGADMDRIFCVAVRTVESGNVKLNVAVHHGLLGRFAQDNDVALVVFDPLLSHVGGDLNANAETEVRAALEPLVKTAAEAGMTVLGLSHFNKGSSTDPMERLMGSRGFSALLRALIVFSRDKDAEEEGPARFVLSQAKSNLGRTDIPSYSYTLANTVVRLENGDETHVPRFVLGPESGTSVEKQLEQVGQTSADVEIGKDCVKWLRSFLMNAGGEADLESIKKAYRALDFSQPAVYRARKALGVTGETVGPAGQQVTVWRLPS